MTARNFAAEVRASLGGVLEKYGFSYQEVFSRSRGAAVEFRSAEDIFFVNLEGGVVSADLILRAVGSEYYRVSINQALWARGLRALPRARDSGHALATMASSLDLLSEQLEARRPATWGLDCCFTMSSTDYEFYLASQRGERSTP